MSAERHPPVVTIAALYGASGSVIGRRVAERLGVSLLDREIPAAVAERTGLTDTAVMTIDDEPRSRIQRLVSTMGRTSTLSGEGGGSMERLDFQERRLRGHIEEFLAAAAVSGGVAIGRGGMVVLASVPWALHVHLGGPPDARIRVRMEQDGIDRSTAERRQKTEDAYRVAYVRRAYGVDGADPSLYHLMLDTTALDVDTCVDLIVAASAARNRHPRPSPTT
jgi:Cytidylate kinase-like family